MIVPSIRIAVEILYAADYGRKEQAAECRTEKATTVGRKLREEKY
jgi:hypothetical protein